MRFTSIEEHGWDTMLKDYLNTQTKDPSKSVFTCYPSAYHIEDDPEK